MEFFFLGDEELVTAFRLIGIHGKTVRDADDAIDVFKHITEDSNKSAFGDNVSGNEVSSGSCHVLIITEETADWLGDYLVNWQLSGCYPLIVEIPAITGRLEGRKTLVESIREAIGIHV